VHEQGNEGRIHRAAHEKEEGVGVDERAH